LDLPSTNSQPTRSNCWAEITHADGYDVTLSPEPFFGPEKLYYVNLGGYDPAEFLEKHKNVFVVADTLPQANACAVKTVSGWTAPHRDEIYEANRHFPWTTLHAGNGFICTLRAPASRNH